MRLRFCSRCIMPSSVITSEHLYISQARMYTAMSVTLMLSSCSMLLGLKPMIMMHDRWSGLQSIHASDLTCTGLNFEFPHNSLI